MIPLDLIAASFTGTATVLLAFRRRSGFLALMAGSVIWMAVALIGSFDGRPIWGQAAMSLWTCGWSAWGWWSWGCRCGS